MGLLLMLSTHLASVSVPLGTYDHFQSDHGFANGPGIIFPRVTYMKFRVHRALGYPSIQMRYEIVKPSSQIIQGPQLIQGSLNHCRHCYSVWTVHLY
jgi:hypothetical protein